MQMEQMQPSGMTVKDYFNVILDRKWIVLLVFLLATAAAVYYAETTPPVYQSMAVLMSESNAMSTSVFPMMNPFLYRRPLDYLTNLQRLMMTTTFMTSVIERMSMEKRIDVGLADVQGSIQLNNPMQTEIIEVIATADKPFKASALADVTAEVLIEKMSGIKNADTDRAINFLDKQLELVNQNLRESEEKLNTFKEKEGLITGSAAGRSSLGFGYGAERYARSSLVGRLAELQDEFTYVQGERELTQASLNSVNDMIAEMKNQLALTQEVDYLLGSVTPQIEQLQSKIAEWQIELTVLQETFTEKHYKVVELEQKIADAQEKLQSEVSDLIKEKSTSVDPISEVQSLIAQVVQLSIRLKGYEHREKLAVSKLEKFKKANPDLLDKEAQLVRLERETRIREKFCINLMEKHGEMLLLREANSQQLRMVDEASAPELPIKPNKTRIISFGILLGIILGIGIAFILEYMDDSIRWVNDVESHLGLPVVGSIPKIQFVDAVPALPQMNDKANLAVSGDRTPKALSREYKKRLRVLQGRLIKNIDSKSPVVESYRSLWANIQFADLDNPIKTMLVTSPGPKEGKSLTTANLALTIAQTDLKVLVIDADLRRPTTHRLFGCQQSPGLSELVIDDLGKIEEYVQNTYADNLYVLPSGNTPPNPTGILGSEKMRRLIREAEKQFDVVLFDSPPIMTMADAPVLATGADLTLLVLQAGQTKQAVATQAKELMRRLNVNIFGVVLNGVDYSKQYGYYYYYHYHENYSKKDV